MPPSFVESVNMLNQRPILGLSKPCGTQMFRHVPHTSPASEQVELSNLSSYSDLLLIICLQAFTDTNNQIFF